MSCLDLQRRRLSGLGCLVGTFRLPIHLERIPSTLRPFALGEYFLFGFFVRRVFNKHFDLARCHSVLLYWVVLRDPALQPPEPPVAAGGCVAMTGPQLKYPLGDNP